ncbi:hypothetical protein FRC12_012205 [Ceratobasidium sp. 428]|nr:hypothetical protein FRC12_012205 [Ceratobasidium sp. 428]
MYNREHSHPIGLENLPFTRKGQKALNSARPKTMPRIPTTSVTSTSEDESGASSVRSPTVSAHGVHLSAGRPDLFVLSPPPPDPNGDMFAQRQAFSRLSSIPSSSSRSSYARPLDHQPPHDYRSPPISTSLESSSPTSHVFQDPPLGYDLPPELPPLRLPEVPTANDRWERLAVLFRSVHSHALTFDYPEDSVNALESMLVRLYLESPLVGGMLREEGTPASMEELGLGVLGEAELGLPGIEGPGVNPLADLDTIGIIGDTGIGMPTAHQNTQLHLPSHLRPH